MRWVMLKSLATPILSLALAVPAFGQVQAERPEFCRCDFHVYRQALEVGEGDLSVYAIVNPYRPAREIVDEPVRLDRGHVSVAGNLAVFEGPVRVGGGLLIGGLSDGKGAYLGGGRLIGPYRRVLAEFNAAVAAGELTAVNGGRATFFEAVTIERGMFLKDGEGSETSMSFQGPVTAGAGLTLAGRSTAGFDISVTVGAGMALSGGASANFNGPVSAGAAVTLTDDSSAVFRHAVRIDSGGLFLDQAGSRASVTLGDTLIPPPALIGSSAMPWSINRSEDSGGRMIIGGELKVLGGNRLIFSLLTSRPADGFIKAESVEIDAGCLAIDNPDGVVKEGEEIILITGRDIQLHGDSRKITTKQGDEFELLVSDNQISAKLIKRAVTKAVWDDDEGYIGHNWLTFSF